MKALFFAFLFGIFSISTLAQEVDSVKYYTLKGIELHDKGDFEGAISCYQKALKIDPNKAIVLAEMAYSLTSIGRYEAAIEVCEKAIRIDPKGEEMGMAYTILGNALDMLKRSEEAIAVYDKGIANFPDDYMLYFNKGITLTSIDKYEEAILCFQTAMQLNPNHPGSHHALGLSLAMQNQNVPALLVLCRFLILEPTGKRAQGDLGDVRKIMSGGAEKTGKKSVTINIDPMMLVDTKGDKKVENNFNTAYIILASTSALLFDKKFKDKNEVERFMYQYESLCKSFKETQADNFGFYWEYYVPYFIELYEEKHLETFAYIIHITSGDKYVQNWLDRNSDKIEEFYEWSSGFDWTLE